MVTTADARADSGSVAAVVPARVSNIELLGEMQQSGFRDAPWLVRRGDGQTIQLTQLLYLTLEAIDGHRDLATIAEEVSGAYGKRASADDVGFLVTEKLHPLGLVKGPDGNDPAVEKPNPLLALRFRVVVSNERVTWRLTAPFAILFNPLLVVAVVVGFVAVTGWLLFGAGLGASARQVLYQPGFLVLAFALTVLSAGFHEFGHAAACRYGGATPGVMGAGLYLVWPAFYTDVTDSYRLDRRGRLRTDLGGLYFNMVFALATVGVWAMTGWDALLVLVPVQLLQMMHQLLPFVRLDGYYILSDITGVPDLFARIRPTLTSMLPWHKTDERALALKPWVRVVVTAWVLAVIPILLFSLTFAVVTFPTIAATAWDSAGLQRAALGRAGAAGEVLGVVGRALLLVAVILPILSTMYVVGRLALRLARNRWGRPILIVAAAGAAFLWWPNGDYEPIQPGDRLRVQDGVRAATRISSGAPLRVSDTDASPSTTTLPTATTTTLLEGGERPVVTSDLTNSSTTEPPATSTPTTAATTATTQTTETTVP